MKEQKAIETNCTPLLLSTSNSVSSSVALMPHVAHYLYLFLGLRSEDANLFRAKAWLAIINFFVSRLTVSQAKSMSSLLTTFRWLDTAARQG